MCLAALLLAIAALYLDKTVDVGAYGVPNLPLTAATARDLMGILATSIIGVGGVSFSITMVALSLTSGQYGPKVIRHFLGNTSSKISLGMFFSTAVFCLAVFVGLSPEIVPKLSVLLALILSGLTLFEFMRFIHRTTSDLQADQIIQRLGIQLRTDLQHSIFEDNGRQHSGASTDTRYWRRAARGLPSTNIKSRVSGYIQAIDYPCIVDALGACESLGALRIRPGDFVVCGQPLLSVWGRDKEGQHKDVCSAVVSAVITGEIRTATDDPQYPITQIHQIAERALSPGINDPGTAISCIDSLTLALSEVVDQDFPGFVLHDDKDLPRLLIRRFDFSSLIENAYSPIRRSAGSQVLVARCLFGSIAQLMALTKRKSRLQLLRTQADRLYEACTSESLSDVDLRAIRQQYQKLNR